MWCIAATNNIWKNMPQSRARAGLIVFFFLIAISALVAVAQAPQASAAEVPSMNVTLPQSVGVWTLPQPARRILPKEIFDYMDGAGELYVGYRFDHLDVYEYESPKDDSILVELYWMKSSDDAYGLLSGDWGGEAVPLRGGENAAPPRALYGAGLLRIWSDNLYARVMAYQETEASKQAVLELGKAIVQGRSNPPVPELVQAMPSKVAGFIPRDNRTIYLRSHLVLNSAYFLSSENLLDLGLECELVTAPYWDSSAEGTQKQMRHLLVRYPSQEAARKALVHFQTVYLSKSGKSATGDRGVVAIEDGWAGFILSGRGIGLVFESPDEPSTRLFLESSKQALEKLEALHE